MYITKSDYLLYKQCVKSFWIQKNNPSLFSESEDVSKLEKGNEVTELSRELFPNGSLVQYSSNISEMVEKTQKMIEEGKTTIYEAAFEYDSGLVICDILNQDANGWNVYEVKSSTKVKERHLDDIAFQLHIIQQNIDINSINVVHINVDYVRNGKLKVHQLFVTKDRTEEAFDRIPNIPSDIFKMKEIMNGDCPKIDIGDHCKKYQKDDFECAAKDYCWSHIPKYSVFNIPRIGKKGMELYNKGIVAIDDIPDDFKLSEAQRNQVQVYKEKKNIVNKEEIQNFLSTFSYPLYFLDFETYQQTIPLFDGIKPYKQIPFQYSLHILESKNAELNHKEFLAKEGTDPKRLLAEQLVRDIPKGVCSVAYNMSFEKMVLKALSEEFPDLAEHLMDIHDNMVDLMVPFQKKWYYTNAMQGSYSIKYVLPALFPNDESLNYKNLNIQNGSMAMDIFEQLHKQLPNDIKRIREDLLAYCKLDTYAMVKIWLFLTNL